METVLPRAIGAPLGHPGRSLRCPRPPRTLRSRRARPDTHERPLLCGRRQRQLLCSRGAPAAEGVDARVMRAVGAAGGFGTCSTRSGRSRRSGRTVGTPARTRQVASAGAGAALSLPTARCRRARAGLAFVAAHPVLARAGTGAFGADTTLLPGVSSRRSRSVRPDRGPLTCLTHTPLTRFALFVQVACCGVSPPAALRLARAGTRRAARPRTRLVRVALRRGNRNWDVARQHGASATDHASGHASGEAAERGGSQDRVLLRHAPALVRWSASRAVALAPR